MNMRATVIVMALSFNCGRGVVTYKIHSDKVDF